MPRLERLPPYKQIANYYRDRIAKGRLKPGQPFPSTPKIAEQWEISYQTAYNVVKELQRTGHVHSISGKGSWVAEPTEDDE